MVDINATLPRFNPTVGVPTSVPFTYRDGISTLQLIEHLKHNFNLLCDYLEAVKKWCEDKADKTDEEIAAINNHLATIDINIEDILSKLGNLDITNDVYDVTQGRYVNSVDAMRNIYRELAVFGARVAQIEGITVEELAEHTTDDVSAVGNLTIFGNSTPRVTDPKTGLPYTKDGD